MSTTEWITDRLPTKKDAGNDCVWVMQNGEVVLFPWEEVDAEPIEPWMPITPPEPYVKPKRYTVESVPWGGYRVMHGEHSLTCATSINTREAAERIAAIYEEMMP